MGHPGRPLLGLAASIRSESAGSSLDCTYLPSPSGNGGAGASPALRQLDATAGRCSPAPESQAQWPRHHARTAIWVQRAVPSMMRRTNFCGLQLSHNLMSEYPPPCTSGTVPYQPPTPRPLFVILRLRSHRYASLVGLGTGRAGRTGRPLLPAPLFPDRHLNTNRIEAGVHIKHFASDARREI